LKSENVDESTTIEIEKILSDYKPLQTVSQKLAQNLLEKKDIVETLQSYTYLQSRFSKILNSLLKVKITYFRYA
jgi:hypothetical protein